MLEAEPRGLVDVVHQAAGSGHHDVSQTAEAVHPAERRALSQAPLAPSRAVPSCACPPHPPGARAPQHLRLPDEALLLLGQRLLPGDQGDAQGRGVRVGVEHLAHLQDTTSPPARASQGKGSGAAQPGASYLLGQLLGGQHDQGAHLAHRSLQQGLRGRRAAV